MKRISLMQKFRHKLSRAYIVLYIYAFKALLGKMFLLFYKIIYSNLSVGKNPQIWGRFYVVMYSSLDSSITIGDNLRIVSDQCRSTTTLYSKCKLTVYKNASIVVGDNVAMLGAVITSKKRIEIGDNTMIAPNVIIVDSDFHVSWPPEKRFDLIDSKQDKEIRIGRNVWIGANTIVLKGVTIGDNSIIGAGSVVVKDIPKNVLAAGNPAVVKKQLDQ